VTSPLEPMYLLRKGYVDNILTILYKLEESLGGDQEESQQIKIAIRLLMLSYLYKSK
jgi:hypothetical protein